MSTTFYPSSVKSPTGEFLWHWIVFHIFLPNLNHPNRLICRRTHWLLKSLKSFNIFFSLKTQNCQAYRWDFPELNFNGQTVQYVNHRKSTLRRFPSFHLQLTVSTMQSGKKFFLLAFPPPNSRLPVTTCQRVENVSRCLNLIPNAPESSEFSTLPKCFGWCSLGWGWLAAVWLAHGIKILAQNFYTDIVPVMVRKFCCCQVNREQTGPFHIYI